jgi:hypothetical protein
VSWIDTNRQLLRSLFDVLGASAYWREDTEELASWMEANWLGAEHGRQEGKPLFDDASQRAARPILEELGLTKRVEPPAERYDEVIVLGAAGIGMHRRIEFVRVSGVAAKGLTILAGMRPHERQSRDGGLDELLATDGRFAPAPGWRMPPRLEHLQAVLRTAGVTDEHAAAALVFPSETDLAELFLSKQWPNAEVLTTMHTAPHPVVNELGQRPWTVRTWQTEGPIPTLRVLNGYPVERPGPGSMRPPRPTTLSTFEEWLALVAADEVPASVLAVVNQPHLRRVQLQLRMHLDAVGLEVQLDVAGCETLSDVDVVLLLGEIPAFIRLNTG